MYAYVKSEEFTAAKREALILENLSQVQLIARRIHKRLPESICLDDLVSTGILGLISAVDNFDPSHNVKLKTYAEYKIRGAILDSLRDLDWAPRQKRKRAKLIEAAIAAGEQKWHRAPAEEEIAKELGIGIEEYREWLVEVRALNIGSLEYANGEVEGHDLLRYLSEDEQNSPARLLERTQFERLLREGIDRMPPMERTVLSLYYHEELTLTAIGQVVNLHVSRISQLKSQATLRLRTYIEKRWPMSRG
jgi:RNA polymerase sigma factor FliA